MANNTTQLALANVMQTTPETSPESSKKMDYMAEVLRHSPNWQKELAGPEPTPQELAKAEVERQDRFQREENGRRLKNFSQFIEKRGSRYAGCQLSTFETVNDKQKTAIKRLADYAEDMKCAVLDGGGVVLFGPSGSGRWCDNVTY